MTIEFPRAYVAEVCRADVGRARTPFDHEDFLFEIKWDGTRTLIFVDRDGYRLVNRRQVDMTYRYPEFEILRTVPPGTVWDAETIVMVDGKPSFHTLLSRENSTSRLKIASHSKMIPATLVLFDQLYADYRPIIDLPLDERQQVLRDTAQTCESPRIVVNQSISGSGRTCFQQAVARDLEGIIAKRRDSRYLPGKRTDAWRKIKKRSRVLCAVVGFLPAEDGSRDFRSLILAAPDAEQHLRFVGKVGTGINQSLRAELNDRLWTTLQDRPVIPCRQPGRWVEPTLYCQVSYLEWTTNGELRDPVFEKLVE